MSFPSSTAGRLRSSDLIEQQVALEKAFVMAAAVAGVGILVRVRQAQQAPLAARSVRAPQ